jgi:hypothetical protein
MAAVIDGASLTPTMVSVKVFATVSGPDLLEKPMVKCTSSFSLRKANSEELRVTNPVS